MGERRTESANWIGRRRRVVLTTAALIAAAIFILDLWSPVEGAVAVLYVIVILLVAQVAPSRSVLGAGVGCGALAIFAFVGDHLGEPLGSTHLRFTVSIVAIVSTTLLSARDRSARTTLGEQARLLELSHDTVIIRDANNIIVYWNDGADALYGWSREEALGRDCDELLETEYPVGEVAAALAEQGHWTAEIIRRRRDGARLTLATRWLLRRDPEGIEIGIIESSADITEQKQAEAQKKRSEEQYKTIFDGAAFAIWEADWAEAHAYLHSQAPGGGDLEDWLVEQPLVLRESLARIHVRDANGAAVRLFEADDRDQLLGNSVLGRAPPEGARQFASVMAALDAGTDTVEREVRYVTVKGRPIDVLLRMRQLPGSEPWSRVIVMAVDLTERNEARARLEQTSAELAHAARVSTLGQLAASIAHEVNQPLSAIITYGKSAKRWIGRPEPDLDEVNNCLDQIVSNGSRAADVIARVRDHARKGPPQPCDVPLGELIEDSLSLVEREARKHDVDISFDAPDRPIAILGDRVQVQQVLVNLALNAIQAMAGMDGERELRIMMEPEGPADVRVSVCDTGAGIAGEPNAIFEPFFTTKPDGMGMGLSICRTIVEAQGGRIGASNNLAGGATISFTLPQAENGSPFHDTCV